VSVSTGITSHEISHELPSINLSIGTIQTWNVTASIPDFSMVLVVQYWAQYAIPKPVGKMAFFNFHL